MNKISKWFGILFALFGLALLCTLPSYGPHGPSLADRPVEMSADIRVRITAFAHTKQVAYERALARVVARGDVIEMSEPIYTHNTRPEYWICEITVILSLPQAPAHRPGSGA